MWKRIIALVIGIVTGVGGARGAGVNVVWLSVEDMSPWLGCYGDRTVPTPNIDRLAREGVRYTNAFATTPVCAPARSTIITGLYATTTGALHMRNGTRSEAGVRRNPKAYDEIPTYEAVPAPGVRCFPEFLRLAGYYATNNVKQDYQFVAPETAWDESSRKAHWKNRGPGQPFFAVFNCTYTHESQAFPNAPRRPRVADRAAVPVPPYYPDTPAVRESIGRTYDNIAAMDQWVGERLAELEAEKLLDSTVVVFFSDHGVGLPRGKRNSCDTGVRVPLIIRWPDGRLAGTTEDRLVSFIDFAPTALSMAGVRQPAYMPGRPFAGEHAVAEAAPYAFATIDRVDSEMDRVRSVTDGRYRYVRNHMPDRPYLMPSAYRESLPMMADLHALAREPGKASPEQWQITAKQKPTEEFYDCKEDPHNVRNVIDDARHRERVEKMRAALDRWEEETGDLGRVQPEARMVREKLWPPDGRQPATELPTGGVAGGTLTLKCETEGACIGWRRKGEAAWRAYDGPVRVDAGDQSSIETMAHRIGYKPSGVVTVGKS
jgi:arylsulfatase A-like enzyme